MKNAKSKTLQPFFQAAETADQLLTASEVGAMLKLRRNRVYQIGIPVVQISARSKRWRLSDVQSWISSRVTL